MSILKTLLFGEIHIVRAEVHSLAEAELSLLERVLCEIREHRRFKPVKCEFGLLSYTNKDGEIITMSAQQLVVGTPYTGALIFTDATGVTGPGPIGALTASDPSITVGLSADGQSYNVEMTTELNGTETIRWHDPAGVVPDATMDVTDQTVAPPFTAAAVAFGPLVPGTTA